jgi:hypothetical protein
MPEQPQDPINQVSQPQAKRSSARHLWPAVAALVLVAAIGSAFAVYNQRKVSTPPANQPAAKDETADWKTYRNEQHGIEFKYPSDWQSEVDSNNEGNDYFISFKSQQTLDGEKRNKEECAKGDPAYCNIEWSWIDLELNILSFDNFKKEYPSESIVDSSRYSSEGIVHGTKVVLNNNEFLRFNLFGSMGPDLYYKIDGSNFVYVFRIVEDKESEKLLHQMLFTFKFIK